MNIASLVVAMLLVCATVTAQPVWKWVLPFIGPQTDEVNSLAISPTNKMYASGTFTDSLTVGGVKIPGFAQYDAFMVGVTKAGFPAEALVMSGPGADESRSVVVDKQGNVYVVGAFTDSVLVGDWIGFAVGQNPDEVGESSDMFLAKFDSHGASLWLKTFGSHDYDENSPYLAVDSVGNVYVGGGIGGTGKIQSKSHISFGQADAFIAKFNSSGEITWLATGGGTGADHVLSLSVTPNGDRVYATGFFHGNVQFGNATPMTAVGATSDFFVWAVNPDATTAWTKRISSSKPDRIVSCAIDRDGKLLTTGAFFGATTFDTQIVNANGETDPDVFLARFARNGVIDFVKKWGGPFGEVGTCVYGDKLGGIYVGGYYDSSATFDAFVPEYFGGRDAFVMRCEPDGKLEWIREAGGANEDEVRAIVVGTDNIPYAAGVFEGPANFSGKMVQGEAHTDGFVAALECGPNTALRPKVKSLEICFGQDSAIVAPAGYPKYEWFLDGAMAGNTTGRFRLTTLTEGQHTVWVNIKDRYGCDKNSDTIQVTVREGLPEPTVTREGTKLKTDAVAFAYQWIHDGVPIPCATSAETNIVGDGLYVLRITDVEGCSRLSNGILVGTSDVNDNDGVFAGLRIYPNPTNGTLNIQGVSGLSDIMIVNNLGMQVYRGTHANQNITLDLTQVPVGAYTVTIRNGQHTTAYRIVRE